MEQDFQVLIQNFGRDKDGGKKEQVVAFRFLLSGSQEFQEEGRPEGMMPVSKPLYKE